MKHASEMDDVEFAAALKARAWRLPPSREEATARRLAELARRYGLPAPKLPTTKETDR